MIREHKYNRVAPACYGMPADYLPDDLALIHVYDACAEWCAKRGLTGKIGDRLPNLVSSEVIEMINADPEAFETRVRQCAYALAMEHVECDHDQSDLGHVHKE